MSHSTAHRSTAKVSTNDHTTTGAPAEFDSAKVNDSESGTREVATHHLQELDQLHHVAIQVNNIERAVTWYRDQFRCQIDWQDETWALLRFANTSLALVIPGEHPPHLAFTMDGAERFGELSPHRDGTRSIYIHDSEGNVVECMDPESI